MGVKQHNHTATLSECGGMLRRLVGLGAPRTALGHMAHYCRRISFQLASAVSGAMVVVVLSDGSDKNNNGPQR